MPNPGRPDLVELLKHIGRWHKTATGYTPIIVLRGSNQPESYTKAEFDSIDPRLFDILTHAADAYNGRSLRLSLELWSNPGIYIPKGAIAKTAPVESYHIRYIQSFMHAPASSVVEVRATYYMIDRTPSGVLYAKQVAMENVPVQRTWLDAAFPKWEAMYEVAVAMDLNMVELTEYLLNYGMPLHRGQLPDFE